MYFLQQRESFIWNYHQLRKVKTWVADNEDNGNNNHDTNFKESITSYDESGD